MTDYWKIDRKLMDHICAISKLELSDKEKAEYLGQISEVLESFKVIKDIETTDELAFHSTKVENVWRDDKVEKMEWDPLGNAKSKEQGYFKGPKIV